MSECYQFLNLNQQRPMTNTTLMTHHMTKVSNDLGLSVKDILKRYRSKNEMHDKVCVFHYRMTLISALFSVEAQADLLGVDRDLIYYRVDKGRRLVNYHKKDYEWIK